MNLRATRLTIGALLLVGVLERVAWNLARDVGGSGGEAFLVAQALAEGRGFADAYRVGHGATAHLLPISPAIAALVYRMFGVGSAASEVILATWSIGLALGTYLLLYRGFGRIGVSRPLRLIGLAWGCIVPTYISQEAIDFRIWEGGLAAFIAALFLDELLALRAARPVTGWAPPVRLALIGSLLFFVNPPMGVGAILCLGLFALRSLDIRQTAAAATAGALAIAMLVVPWALRNAQVLGTPVLLRSNAGLELSLTNYPGAEAVVDEHRGFMARLNAIHPAINADAYAQMHREGGEVAYSRRLGRTAMDWIADHPGFAAWQAAGHFREMFVPAAWKFDAYGTARVGRIKAVLAQGTGILGLIGLALALRRFGEPAAYPALFVTTVALLISPFQPVVRYMYMIYPIMVFFAACTLLPLRRADPRSSTPGG